MHSRRSFLRLGVVALGTAAAQVARPSIRAASAPQRVWLPLLQSAATDAPPDDAPILGAASGTATQANAHIARRAAGYTAYDVTTIVAAYQQHGEQAGLDWFMALAQLCHETGSLTSWWAQRPRRNPAGIGVTGRVLPGTPDAPPGRAWAWRNGQWEEGVSFATWADDAVPAHLGRLLAYALRDEQMTDSQRALAAAALDYRPLPGSWRGIASGYVGLNGRWAVPGTSYGQAIMALAARMRGSA